MEKKEYEKQIDIKELRIGNIVYGTTWLDHNDLGDVVRSSVCKVMGIDENRGLSEGWSYMLENMNVPEEDNYNGLYGVPLTEDWFIKFKFKKTKSDIWTFWSKESGLFEVLESCPMLEILYKFYSGSGTLGNYLYYVHQLQNIFFALTGEELTIKGQHD